MKCQWCAETEDVMLLKHRQTGQTIALCGECVYKEARAEREKEEAEREVAQRRLAEQTEAVQEETQPKGQGDAGDEEAEPEA